MIKKIFITILILTLILSNSAFNVFATTEKSTSIKKVVSIVYDDSGSMDNENDDWAYASYSLQNLIGLMNSNDELSIVKMSNPTQTVNFNLTDNEERKNDIKSIENWTATANTPFIAVETASSWLKNKNKEYANSRNVEFWLIVITDGKFGSDYPNDIKNYLEEIKNSMGNNKYEGVLVAIGNKIPAKVKNDWESVTGYHVITADNSDDIVTAMSEVSGLILGQGGQSANIIPTLSDDGKSITFDSSLPLKKFIIFEQNQNIGIKNIVVNEIKGNVVADFSTKKPADGKINSRIIHCEAINSEYLPPGKITIHFNSKIDIDKSKFKILTVPAVNLSLKVIDQTGNLISNINNTTFKEGEIVEFAAVVTSSIDNSIIDLRNWENQIISELIVNDKSIKMEYSKQDNMFYGKYKVEKGNNFTYSVITLPGYFRTKSDIVNISPIEKIDNVSSNISDSKIDVSYKYTTEYEEIKTFQFTVTGTDATLEGMCDFEFKNIPKGITISVNGIFVDEKGKLSLKIYNGIPAEVKIYRNKDYNEIESSKIMVDVTSKQYQLEWTNDSITEIILNPVKRNISIEKIKLDKTDNLNINNFDKENIYILSVLGNSEYLSKEELETLIIDFSKTRGISLKHKVIEYNGRYALSISCEKKLIKLLIETGDITSSLNLKTLYNEESNNIDISFKIIDSFTKYILPIILLVIAFLIIGYIPIFKKRFNKNYCIQVNGEYEMIKVKPLTKIIPYITEKGIGSDLKVKATSNSNKITIINNFYEGQQVYIDEELIEKNISKFDLSVESKLKVIDGYRETVYMYLDSRGNNLFDETNGISDLDFYNDDFTSSNYNDDYY